MIYISESKALHESFSDIWAEFFDWEYGPTVADPDAVRWLVSEDFLSPPDPNVAFRSMKDPPAFSHPDTTSSALWEHDDENLGKGHINAGVGNKLCFLVTQGDTFNGRTIEPMDEDLNASKEIVLELYYEARHTLPQTADYEDLHWALSRAGDVIGLSASQAESLQLACEAVEIAGRTVEIRSGDDTATRLLAFTSFGDAILYGEEARLITDAETLTPSADVPEFVVEDREGDVVALVRGAGDGQSSFAGDVVLKGAVSVYHGQAFPEPAAGKRALKVLDDEGNCVALIDEGGNIRVRGEIWIQGQKYND